MNFWQAVNWMERGKRVRIKSWDKNSYWFIEGNAIMKKVVGFKANGGFDNDVMIHNSALFAEWELYEESEKLYSFEEAMAALKVGKEIKQKGDIGWWGFSGEYLCVFISRISMFHNDWMIRDKQ